MMIHRIKNRQFGTMNPILWSGLIAAAVVCSAAIALTMIITLVWLAARAASMFGEGAELAAGLAVLVFFLLWGVLYGTLEK